MVKQTSSIFHSARLKLTGFYLAVILVFSLALTIGVRSLAEHEFDRSGGAERGVVRNLLFDIDSAPPQPNTFNRFQNSQAALVRHHLDEDVIIINVIALVVGGILSYWYAGRALKPIEDAHAVQARFASDASHELRTPLTNLKIENEIFLRQKSFSQGDARKLISSNLEEVERLENLAGSLLALTEYENVQLELAPLDIQSSVESALEHVAKPASAKKIKFTTNLSAEKVLGHNDSLMQLIGIVLDNAIKYSKAGGEVFIDGISVGQQYHLSIRDNGSGITEDDLPHIFERLYRGDKSRGHKTKGYGLGLALGRQIARANDAQITARNYPSGGAQFVISLPTAKSSGDEASSQAD
jgi:two-component system sensor histidine kinase CiaH